MYVDLHHSTQKGGNVDHWRSCLLGVIAEVHIVLDRVFEVVEEGMFFLCFTKLDRSGITISKGLGLRRLEDEYTIFMMTGMARVQVLVDVLKEFLR